MWETKIGHKISRKMIICDRFYDLFSRSTQYKGEKNQSQIFEFETYLFEVQKIDSTINQSQNQS